ncbi:hypothetical protein EUGRSUZ_L00984 [Eucalyptus grandis]|uniref:Uncharacterized protein n=1 Tax=Eucalyptus grandis TaxID=71139 RepID=A0A058ZVE6_EUCGR|nr:hypothetical protein EUGRSUZ_L00984 [Eucalyptus grandis]
MTTAFAESFARLFNKKKERKTKRKIGFTSRERESANAFSVALSAASIVMHLKLAPTNRERRVKQERQAGTPASPAELGTWPALRCCGRGEAGHSGGSSRSSSVSPWLDSSRASVAVAATAARCLSAKGSASSRSTRPWSSTSRCIDPEHPRGPASVSLASPASARTLISSTILRRRLGEEEPGRR